MPRRAAAQIRPVEPDPVHRSALVQQVINKVMLDGKKSTAERIVYDALGDPRRALGQGPGRGARGVDQGADPGPRGPLPPRRRRDLPGAGRGPRAPRPHARRPLAGRVRPPAPREDDGPAPGQRAARRPVSSRAAPTSARTTSTAWRRPTRPSPTTAGSGRAARAGGSTGQRGGRTPEACCLGVTVRPQSSTVEMAIARIASRSHGVVTRVQLLRVGITGAEIRWRLRPGRCCASIPASTASGTGRRAWKPVTSPLFWPVVTAPCSVAALPPTSGASSRARRRGRK